LNVRSDGRRVFVVMVAGCSKRWSPGVRSDGRRVFVSRRAKNVSRQAENISSRAGCSLAWEAMLAHL